MTNKEVANYLRCGETTIWRLCREGILEKDKHGITEESVKKLTGNAQEIYLVEEVAEKLGVSEQTIRNRYEKGKIKGFNMMSLIRITEFDTDTKVKTGTKPNAKKKVEKKSKKLIVKKITVDDLEITVTVTEGLPASNLIKEFVKVLIDKSDIEDKVKKFMEML